MGLRGQIDPPGVMEIGRYARPGGRHLGCMSRERAAYPPPPPTRRELPGPRVAPARVARAPAVRTHTHMHAHTRTCTHTHTHARTHTRMHAHTHACTHTHAHARTPTRMHAHTRTHTRARPSPRRWRCATRGAGVHAPSRRPVTRDPLPAGASATRSPGSSAPGDP